MKKSSRSKNKRNRNSGFSAMNNSTTSMFRIQNQMIREVNATKKIGRPNNKGM